jgi:hypothetical protein
MVYPNLSFRRHDHMLFAHTFVCGKAHSRTCISLWKINARMLLSFSLSSSWRYRPSLTSISSVVEALWIHKWGTHLERTTRRCAYKKQTPWPLSLHANYTDWSTATCRRNLVPTFVDRGMSRGQRGGSPTVVNLSFLDRSRYFSFK